MRRLAVFQINLLSASVCLYLRGNTSNRAIILISVIGNSASVFQCKRKRLEAELMYRKTMRWNYGLKFMFQVSHLFN